jgi:hypothetical protein
MNGCGSEFTEVTRNLELPPESDNKILGALRRRPGSTSSAAGRIGPINPVKSFLTCRALDPELNSRQGHTKRPRDSSHCNPTTNHGNHLPSPYQNSVFGSSSFLQLQNVSAPL